MPIVGDYDVIRSNNPITIGDGQPVWETHFSSGGRHAAKTAVLIFNVKSLCHAIHSVVVKVNDTEVGRIHPYSLPTGLPNTDNDGHWFTQMIAFEGSVLKGADGKANKLEVESVGFPGAAGGNQKDDFELKDVVCFYGQEA